MSTRRFSCTIPVLPEVLCPFLGTLFGRTTFLAQQKAHSYQRRTWRRFRNRHRRKQSQASATITWMPTVCTFCDH